MERIENRYAAEALKQHQLEEHGDIFEVDQEYTTCTRCYKLAPLLYYTPLLREQPTPHIGMGATVSVGSDCYPYTVVAVGKNTIMLVADAFQSFGQVAFTENQTYVYSTGSHRPGVLEGKAHLRNDGRYYLHGCPVSLGHRRAYRDPHF